MALHYRGDVDRFTDESGRFVPRERGMRSSNARREYEEEGIAQLLTELAKVSGLDIGEILDESEPRKSDSQTDSEDYDEPDSPQSTGYSEGVEEDTEEGDFDLDNDYGDSIDDYTDDLMNDLDIDPETETDPYADI
jgi:hypothetical protein